MIDYLKINPVEYSVRKEKNNSPKEKYTENWKQQRQLDIILSVKLVDTDRVDSS